MKIKLLGVLALWQVANGAFAQTVRTLYDFERGFEGWQLSGECWGRGGTEDANYAFGRFSGWSGGRYASSAHGASGGIVDSGTGRALSDAFKIEGDRIRFLIAGGRNDGVCELRLLVKGEVVRTQSGNGSDRLEPAQWVVGEFQGQEARLELIDNKRTGPRGYLLVDRIELVSNEESPRPAPTPVTRPLGEAAPSRPIMVVEGRLPLPPAPTAPSPAAGFFASPLSVQLPDGTKATAKRCIQLEATGYSPDPSENGGLTVSARGTPLGRGIAAVDPKVIPLGTKLWVEGYGYALADDVGGAIKGKRIDLCHATLAEGNAYGRKSVKVWILETTPGR